MTHPCGTEWVFQLRYANRSQRKKNSEFQTRESVVYSCSILLFSAYQKKKNKTKKQTFTTTNKSSEWDIQLFTSLTELLVPHASKSTEKTINIYIYIYIFLLKITDEPITRIISKQLDIKLGPFTKEELDSVLKKNKNRKAAGLDEIPPEVWKTRQFDDILLRQCNAVYSQNRIERWMKGCILPFPKKATSD